MHNPSMWPVIINSLFLYPLSLYPSHFPSLIFMHTNPPSLFSLFIYLQLLERQTGWRGWWIQPKSLRTQRYKYMLSSDTKSYKKTKKKSVWQHIIKQYKSWDSILSIHMSAYGKKNLNISTCWDTSTSACIWDFIVQVESYTSLSLPTYK